MKTVFRTWKQKMINQFLFLLYWIIDIRYRALHSSHFRVCGQVNTILFPDVGKSTLIWVVNACTHEEITRVARSNVLALPTSQFGFKTNVRVCDKWIQEISILLCLPSVFLFQFLKPRGPVEERMCFSFSGTSSFSV